MRKKLAVLLAATMLSLGVGVATAPAAGAAPECGVRVDKLLWCGNRAPIVTYYSSYEDPTMISGQLLTSFSWFDCWVTGQEHAGGNATWYHTTPDWGTPGYVPAVNVFTPSWFDANPSAHGLRHC